MNKQTKATAISRKTKEAVWARDGEHCVKCGRWVPVECACAHFIPRSRGGLGVEQNILTLCDKCHKQFDQGTGRTALEKEYREYLQSIYPHWDEKELVYRWQL